MANDLLSELVERSFEERDTSTFVKHAKRLSKKLHKSKAGDVSFWSLLKELERINAEETTRRMQALLEKVGRAEG